MNETEYEKIVDALVADGYIILENAIEKGLCEKLLESASDESLYKRAGISSSQNLHIDGTKRRDKTRWLDADGAAMSAFLAWSDSLRNYLNRTLYLGLSYYEAHFAIYEEGDFYEKHLDAFVGSKNRVVTTVLYLNEGWSEEDGGALLIYDDERVIERVAPKMGTLVIFMSDRFPHEVLPAKKKRHSIAGWFRVDKR